MGIVQYSSKMKTNKTRQIKKDLLKLLKKKALKRGRIVLSSGKVSNFYLDGRLVTLSAEGAYWIACLILELIKDKKITAIGGPTLGADSIIGAVLSLAAVENRKLDGFIIRKSRKKHGRQRLIEGPVLRRGGRVVLIDDVATTGGSLVEAKNVLQEKGVIVDCVIVVVDRQEGAARKLARAGCRLISLFKKKDIV